MSGLDRHKLLLGVLAVVFAVVLWPGGGPERSSRGSSPTARVGAVRSGEAPIVEQVVTVELDTMLPRAGAFEIGRDPFRFGVVERRAAPPPPPPRPTPKPEPVVTPPPGPPAPQPPSASHLKFLGSFGRADAKIAVLTSGEEIINVREGDLVEETFRVEQIGFESITLGFLEFPDLPGTRLPIGG